MTTSIAQTLLEAIAEKRTGGKHNFQGINYQLMYACYRLLEEFSYPGDNKQIRLEGLEDVDVNSTVNDGSELVQLKHSTKPFNADKFWQTGALKNFFEVYQAGATARFVVIHNTDLKGELLHLANGNVKEQNLTYWNAKIRSAYKMSPNADTADFLSKVSFRKWTYQDLQEQCIQLLLGKYGVDDKVAGHYLKALFYYAFEWSKFRIVVTKQIFLTALTTIEDSFSHTPKNQAIEHGWITEVLFDKPSQNVNLDDYFDGRAARPSHIAAGLPVQRYRWEKKIAEELTAADAVVIHASSGQGKSTLAWQTAFSFSGTGYSIYQLNSCQSWNEVSAISDFLKTRLRIGQVPLVVIDNLSKQLGSWGHLLEAVADLPVKMLVTTREEDWHRYSSDESKAKVKLLSITLSQDEAKQIYTELKKRDKVAAGIDGWQHAYEQIADKGLLIEYTYLLTKGEQLATRLKQQIKQLSEENDAAAKIKILRLISLADCMNVKLETDKLLAYVKNEVGITSDQGIIIEQLEKEYHLKLDKRLVEGLHPVRSRHLVDILHRTISLDFSLAGIFTILGEDYVYDFAMALAEFVPLDSKPHLLNQLAANVASRKLPEAVHFLDGLTHAEPQQYWLQNRHVYDESYKRGGLLLFVADTVPFANLSTIENFAKSSLKGSENFLKLAELKQSLTPYSFVGSDVVLFAGMLARHLQQIKLVPGKLEGLEFMMRWFERLTITFPSILDVSEDTVLEALNTQGHLEVKELFTYFRLREPMRYRQFVQEYKDVLIGWLKEKTSTLTIEERGNDLYIEYLPDDNANNVNEESVYRIEMAYHFMPYYEHYCTDIIYLPFPSESIFDAIKVNGHKRMTSKALYHKFDVHFNQIWTYTIESNYSHLSAYHWQLEQIERRKEALECCRQCIKLFESIVEGNKKKAQAAYQAVRNHGIRFQQLHALAKQLKRPLKYFEQQRFSTELQVVNGWFASVSNFINQYEGLVATQSDYATSSAVRLPVVNLKEAAHNLPAMQQAFIQISAGQYPYFNNQNLEEEQEIFARLLKSVMFYVDIRLKKSSELVRAAKTEINNWWQQQEKEKLHRVYTLLDTFSQEYGYTVFKPLFFKKEALYDTVTIGVEGLDLSDNRTMGYLSVGLSELAKTDFAFFEIVFVENGHAIIAQRYTQEYFQRFYDLKMGLEVDTANLPMPLFREITDELVASLPGVNIPPTAPFPEIAIFVKVVMDLWHLTEYRQRLNKANQHENTWLHILEAQESNIIDETILNLDKQDLSDYESWIQSVKAGQSLPDKQQFIQLLNDYLNSKVKKSEA